MFDMVSVVNDNAFTNKDFMQQEHDYHGNIHDLSASPSQQQQQQLEEISQSSDASNKMDKFYQKRKKKKRILDNTDNQSVNSIEQEQSKHKPSNSRRQDSFDDDDAIISEITPLTSSTEGSVKSLKRYSSFEDEDPSPPQSSQQNEPNSFKRVATFATLTKWWKKRVDDKISNRKNMEKTEERKMRFKLQYHFMTPFEKYKIGRKPWKLGIQILKIILVTTQVLLFGADRFASVAFLRHTHTSFKNIFIPHFDGSPSFSLYSRDQLVSTIQNVQEKYEVLTNVSIGKYWHVSEPPPPVLLCENLIKSNFSRKPLTQCSSISKQSNFSKMLYDSDYFDRIMSLQLLFNLKAVYLNRMGLHHRPECLDLFVKINIDNMKHDGRMRVSLKLSQNIIVDDDVCNDRYKRKHDGTQTTQSLLIAFDILVITICSISAFLCVRSVVKSVLLAKAAKKYFAEFRHEQLTNWDLLELINKWFPVIATSDMLSITGSIYKIYVDKRDIGYYNLSSMFLGVGVILVWVGFLRFFTYLKEYNILLITLRVAAPSLLRFMFCAMFIFFGFTFCGWVVLGAYHEKFTTFLTTAECLFSLVNGDDMYPTFANMPSRNVAIWIFSKIYLYIFVSLFIYAVLSTFISIVMDAYERLKDYGRMPPTRIECFITGRTEPPKTSKRFAKCDCQQEPAGNKPANEDGFFASGLLNKRTLSESQFSLVSASLE